MEGFELPGDDPLQKCLNDVDKRLAVLEAASSTSGSTGGSTGGSMGGSTGGSKGSSDSSRQCVSIRQHKPFIGRVLKCLNQYSEPDRQNSQYILMCPDDSARMEYCGLTGPTG